MCRRYSYVILVFLAIALCSCMVPVELGSRFTDSIGLKFGAPLCRYQVVSLVDARYEKLSLGKIAGRPVQCKHIEEWIGDGLESIHLSGKVPQEPVQHIIQFEVLIKKVHGKSSSTSMSFNLVLELRYMVEGREFKRKVYRGCFTTINWISGDVEIKYGFNKALKRALVQIKKDLNATCDDINAKGKNLGSKSSGDKDK